MIDFNYQNMTSEARNMQTHIFLTEAWSGEICETGEMSPKWFKIPVMPFGKMWVDDQYRFSKLISQEYFEASFDFEDDKIVSFGFKV